VTTTPTAPADLAGSGEPAPPRRGSLFRAEAHRFSARRFIRVLLLLSVLGYLVIVPLVALTQYSKPSAAALEDAQRQLDVSVAEQRMFYEKCLEDVPEGETVENFCGPPDQQYEPSVSDFLDRQPFLLETGLPEGSVAIGVMSAVLAFLIGATYVGAEWSSRSMVALLFWEPRRLKVMGVKLAITAVAAALLAVLAQAVWWGSAEILARTRGSRGTLPDGFWPDLLGQQARIVLFVVMASWLGFGIANLVRNTGASLGVGFVYFVIVENAVRGFKPAWQEWLLVENASALMLTGGHRIFIYNDFSGSVEVDEQGTVIEGPREIVLSNLHGGLVLGMVTAVLVVIGVLLFKRRDLH